MCSIFEITLNFIYLATKALATILQGMFWIMEAVNQDRHSLSN